MIDKVETNVVKKEEIGSWMSNFHMCRPSPAKAILFSGDRWSCVEQVVLALVQEKMVGLASIAPEGEESSGQPTIVAIYVLRGYRALGIGYKLLNAAIDYMVAHKLTPIRVDVLNTKAAKMIDRLPPKRKQQLTVVDMSRGGSLDVMLDM